jgi:glycine cleavage system transcriptional repressor
MKTQLLVTSIGEDRPGIVARITEVFVKHGANLEESRMAILGGEFAAIMLVSVAEKQIPALQDALQKLKDEGLTITTKPTSGATAEKTSGHGAYTLVLRGADHEGIVHTVAACLRDRSINIESLETEVIHAPVSGTPLFTMKANLQVPSSVGFEELRSKLAEIARTEAVDIDIDETPVSDRPKVRL